jgi:hypothetical protein
MEQCKVLSKDDTASTKMFQKTLVEALEVIGGTEARNVILEAEVQQLRHANDESKKQKPRRGRVGCARVYEQKEVEEVRRAEEARMTRGASARGGTSRGQGTRGSRRGGSRKVTERHNSTPQGTIEPDIESTLADLDLESEDSS